MTTLAKDLAAKLNAYIGDNWAQEVPQMSWVDETATHAAGYDADRMGDPGVETTLLDGSKIRYSGGCWVEIR